MRKIPCEPSVGADVEWLLYDLEKKEPVVACGLVGGTKEKPLSLGEGYFVQEDNVMVEWNIPPAVDRWQDFNRNCEEAVDRVKDHIHKKLGQQYTIMPYQEYEFKEELLQSPQARTFGCEPDFDAYLGGKQRPDGAVAVLGNTRSCGGHLHIGGNFNCPDFVAALFMEMAIMVFGRVMPDHTTKRAQWYGQPGIFRSKPYGIEYRSPDAMWSRNQQRRDIVGIYAMKTAYWLTETPADRLQQTFRQIPWSEVRKYALGGTVDRNALCAVANEAGFEL